MKHFHNYDFPNHFITTFTLLLLLSVTVGQIHTLFILIRKPIKRKENSKFIPVVLHLKPTVCLMEKKLG